jgi:hypothetical protein
MNCSRGSEEEDVTKLSRKTSISFDLANVKLEGL